MIYLGNAFALSMLARERQSLRCTPCTAAGFRLDTEATPWESCVGHADIARLISAQIGRDVPVVRRSISLAPGDSLYVVQYSGPRLPEGMTSLPEGARLDWWLVEIDCD